MASRPTGFGMTAELKAKTDGKYDPELEREACEFIKEKTGKQIQVGSFHESLKDGVILCHLANALKPGSVKKVNESKMAFKMMENISNFLIVCESCGVQKTDTFQTVDLYENQNIPQVITGILALKRRVSGGEVAPHTRNFTDEQLKAGQGVIGLQMGTNKGASQAGMTGYGTGRKIHHEHK